MYDNIHILHVCPRIVTSFRYIYLVQYPYKTGQGSLVFESKLNVSATPRRNKNVTNAFRSSLIAMLLAPVQFRRWYGQRY